MPAAGDESVAGFRESFEKGGGQVVKELSMPFPNVEFQALLTEDPGRPAVTLFQALRQEGYRGGISALRGAVRRLRPCAAPAAFAPLTFGRAEAAQVDWGEFGDVFGIGRPVRSSIGLQIVTC